MGLLDVLSGRRKLRGPAPDRLFAMSTAYVTMQSAQCVTSAGRAAIVFQSLATADFRTIVGDMEEVVRARAADTGTVVESHEDSFGFSWMVLADDDFDELVAGIGAVAGALSDGGYGERVLCAVFGFRDERERSFYWIYNVKRGTFSPFAPTGPHARDSERELVLRAQLAGELPIEADLARWFALWGIPL